MKKIIVLFFVLTTWHSATYADPTPVQTYDIVIYGGTSSGVISALQAAKMGKSVALVVPGKHIGGATTSGLGWVDINNYDLVGGLTSLYFHLVWQYYQKDSSWIYEPKHSMLDQRGQPDLDDPRMWTIEPRVAEKIFKYMVSSAQIPIFYNQRLNLQNGVTLSDQRITQIEMESGMLFQGKMFIDATYEGDLLAGAHVSYIVGREPNSRYGETANGICPNTPKKIDP